MCLTARVFADVISERLSRWVRCTAAAWSVRAGAGALRPTRTRWTHRQWLWMTGGSLLQPTCSGGHLWTPPAAPPRCLHAQTCSPQRQRSLKRWERETRWDVWHGGKYSHYFQNLINDCFSRNFIFTYRWQRKTMQWVRFRWLGLNLRNINIAY